MRKILIVCIILPSLLFSVHAGLDDAFYQPDSKEYTTPDQDGYAYETAEFKSEDGTQLSGWFIPAKGEALGTVIHFHGNAQNMTAHYSFVSWLPANGFNLFVFDYRGYGKSEGTPSREGVFEDSIAAVDYIKTREDIDQHKIILFGQSLGGANALAVAGSQKFEGIVGILSESAFSTYKSAATDHAGLLTPLAFAFIGNKYSPKAVVKNIAPIPLVFIHGTNDQVVEYKHAEKLYKAAAEPKELWTIKGGYHTEALGRFRSQMAPRIHELFKTWVETTDKEESKEPLPVAAPESASSDDEA